MNAPDIARYQTAGVTSLTVPRVLTSARTDSHKVDPSTVPLVIMGIDGVLAPLKAMHASDTWGDWAPAPGAQVRVPVSRSMGFAISQIPGELVFCSDWGSRSSVVAEALGLDDVFSLRRELPSRWWWKLDAVRAFLGSRPRRPIAWVDDELRQHPEAAAWMMRAGVPALLLSPDPREGLTADDIDRLNAFCRDCSHSSSLEISVPAGAVPMNSLDNNVEMYDHELDVSGH